MIPSNSTGLHHEGYEEHKEGKEVACWKIAEEVEPRVDTNEHEWNAESAAGAANNVHASWDGPRLSSEIERQLTEFSEIRQGYESVPHHTYVDLKHLEAMKIHEQELRDELAEARE